jgi:hypothetical protein
MDLTRSMHGGENSPSVSAIMGILADDRRAYAARLRLAASKAVFAVDGAGSVGGIVPGVQLRSRGSRPRAALKMG